MNTLLTAIIVLNGIATPATFCEGVRLDRSMTYHKFLQEYALDLDAQKNLAANQALLKEAKIRAYNQQAPNVRRGQRHLCGQESQNWQD